MKRFIKTGSTKLQLLVQELVDSKVEVEEFMMKFQREFVWLIPFLKVFYKSWWDYFSRLSVS